MKITAIHTGGDWADAAADYFVLPDGVNAKDEWDKWLNHHRPFIPFNEWLIKAGARRATIDEIYVLDLT